MTDNVTNAAGSTVAERLAEIVTALTGLRPEDLPVRMRTWDGGVTGPADPDGTLPVLVVNSPTALTRLLWSPGELGLAQAYVTGEIDAEAGPGAGDGDALAEGFARLAAVARRPGVRLRLTPRAIVAALRAAGDLGVVGLPPHPPASQISLRGRLHTRRRDRSVIAHHYDLSTDFYAQILDDTLSYSSAYFGAAGTDGTGEGARSTAGTDGTPGVLEAAQRAKLDLICRKLRLGPGQHLLDIGCGWGATAIHAATEYGVRVTAVTISTEQYRYVTGLVAERGLEDRISILLQDYRDITGQFDAVSSIEMGEHVGEKNYPSFLRVLRDSVRPGGRVLVQQMSRRGRHPGGGPFIEAFIAPDMTMRPLGETVELIERRGLEVLGVQGMREDYARTVDHWIARFLAHRERIIELVGEEVFRVWHLYLIGGGMAFREGRMGVDQILAVRRVGASAADRENV